MSAVPAEPCDWTLIDKLYADFEALVLGEQAAADQIEEELDRQGLTYSMHIDPRQMGFDPLNRKVMEKEIPPLMSDIHSLGFSLKQTSHALASEEIPGENTIELHNLEVTRDSAILAPVMPGEIIFGSLACQHCNGGLRAIALKAPSQQEGMSTDGKWDKEKIRQKNGGQRFVDAVEHGLLWKVVRHPVRKARPKVLKLLQEARNLSGHTSRPVSETEILTNMHDGYVDAQAGGQAVDWTRLKRAAIRCRPPCQDIIDDLAFVLIKKSGGIDGSFLKEWHLFHSTFAGSRRTPGALYNAAARLPHADVALACLKVAATCPKAYVENGMVNWVKEADINGTDRDDTAKALASKAQEMLETARRTVNGWTQGKGPAVDKTWNKLFGFLDCSVAQILLGKAPASTVAPAVRLQLAAVSFAEKVAEAFPGHPRDVLLPAARKALAAEQAVARQAGGEDAATEKAPKGGAGSGKRTGAAAEKPVVRLEEYVDGKLDDALAELRLKGFDLGMAVQARAPTAPAGSPAPALPATAPTKYTIKAVGEDNSGDKKSRWWQRAIPTASTTWTSLFS